jgi:hypothetical protein
MDGRVEVSFPAPSMTPYIAAGRAGKARMFEHKDVRVRAGARPARSACRSLLAGDRLGLPSVAKSSVVASKLAPAPER